MKKLVAIILAVAIMLTLGTAVAMADETATGTITITNAVPGAEYNAYRILDLESYDTVTNAYSYKLNSKWAGFFAAGAKGSEYIKIDDSGVAKWIKGTGEDDGAEVMEFAREALKYAETNHITPTKTETASESSPTDAQGRCSVLLQDLPLGYYLIDSNLGALCALDTTNADVNITEKNEKPVLKKQVQTTTGYGETNTVTIGKIFNYRIQIDNVYGAQNYVVYDELSEGLTFMEYEAGQTIKTANTLSPADANVIGTNEKILILVESEGESDTVSARKAVPTTDYTLINGPVTDKKGNSHSFKITFTEKFLNELQDGEFIVIYYRARLNEDAVIGNSGNPNTAKLEYGNSFETEPSSTITKTWSVDVFKYTGNDVPLPGAEFKLRTKLDGVDYYYHFTKVDDRDGIPTYRACYNEDPNTPQVTHNDNDDTKRYDSIITDTTGKFKIIGLRGNSTYYLEETKAPDGYNKISTPRAFTIDAAGNITINGAVTTVIKVENKTGSEMPSTGAAGTAVFCIFGSLTMLISGVILVNKKKMSVYED